MNFVNKPNLKVEEDREAEATAPVTRSRTPRFGNSRRAGRNGPNTSSDRQAITWQQNGMHKYFVLHLK